MPEIVSARPYAFAAQVPASEVYGTPAFGAQLRDEAIRSVVKAAIDAKVASDPSGLTIRPILPNTDLGLTNESWVTPTLTANAYAQVISQAIAIPLCYVFYGVFNRSSNPLVSVLRYRQGAGGAGSTKLIITLEEMIAQNQNVLYHPPAVYIPGNTVYVDAYGLTGVTTQALGLIGFVAEPRGKNMVGGIV